MILKGLIQAPFFMHDNLLPFISKGMILRHLTQFHAANSS